ncbi:MAG: glycosyltransferase [Candidatus Shapirobacteria bacterium]
MKSNNHFLSVIVPVYRQQATIKADITSIHRTLSQLRYNFELIVVVDGTNIDQSYQRAKGLKLAHLKVIGYPNNYGKGYAVRYGMAHSRGDYISFIDAGMEIDPNGISLLIEHLEWYKADIVCASKRHPASQINYPLERRILSFFAQTFTRLFLNLPISDTQAGLKIFRRKVLVKTLPRLLVKHYAFDLEILAVAYHLGFKRIYEAPIKLNYDFVSLTHAAGLRVIWRSFIDALAVFYRLRLRHYYDDSNSRRWSYNSELSMRVNTG